MKSNPEVGFEIIRITLNDIKRWEEIGDPDAIEETEELRQEALRWEQDVRPRLEAFKRTRLYASFDDVFEKFYTHHDLIETTARYILICFITHSLNNSALFKHSDESNLY